MDWNRFKPFKLAINIFTIVLGFFILLGFSPSQAKVYKWVDENGRVQFSDKPPVKKNETERIVKEQKKSLSKIRKQTKPKPLPISVSSGNKRLPDSITLKLQSLLSGKRFSDLNQILEHFQKQLERDITQEEKLFTAYKAFQFDGDGYEQLLSEWITAHPKFYQPYLARASYYYRMGWNVRGSKWASETEQMQFDVMQRFFLKARTDLKKALKINPKIMPGYGLLINMAKADKNNPDEFMHTTVALSFTPASYEIRKIYLNSLTPRWGGSFEAMMAFAEESEQYSNDNPRIKMLPGLILEEAGDLQKDSKAYKLAIETFTKALAYGEIHSVYMNRGLAYSFNKQFDEALSDYSKAIALYAEESNYYYRRAYIYIQQDKLELAKSDILKAKALKYNKEKIKKRSNRIAALFASKGYKLKKNGKVKQAIKAYNHSLKLNPVDAYNYSRRARALIDNNKLKAAEKDIKKAIKLDPSEYGFYQLLDWILAKRKDWNQIVSYWDKYIQLHSDNSNAYVERGGAKYRKGDIVGAVEDAKIAADMGNLQGKEAYQKFRHLVK